MYKKLLEIIIAFTTLHSCMIKSVVIAGCGGSGKSSIVNKLGELGYPVIHEVARRVLTERKSFPLTREEKINHQTLMAQRQYLVEQNILVQNHTEPYFFLDRGLGDNLAYCRYLIGYVPEDIQFLAYRRKYDYVFISDQLPFKKDGIRWEKNAEEAKHIQGLIYESYRQQGYAPISIPVVQADNPTEGVLHCIDFIFENLKGGE